MPTTLQRPGTHFIDEQRLSRELQRSMIENNWKSFISTRPFDLKPVEQNEFNRWRAMIFLSVPSIVVVIQGESNTTRRINTAAETCFSVYWLVLNRSVRSTNSMEKSNCIFTFRVSIERWWFENENSFTDTNFSSPLSDVIFRCERDAILCFSTFVLGVDFTGIYASFMRFKLPSIDLWGFYSRSHRSKDAAGL